MATTEVAEGALSSAMIERLRAGYEMSGEDRAVHNAVTGSPLGEVALDRSLVAGEHGHFSHRVATKGTGNQKASGRCWMFAAFNVMRPALMHRLKLEEFQFSSAYLQFWDKMEKSNLYLEEVIELRGADRLDRDWLAVNEKLVGDGGWWNYAAELVEKYGAVPAEVMPETHGSSHTAALNEVLERLLRVHAVRILEAHEAGEATEALRERKAEALGEVYRLLVLNLGEPPTEFRWRYETKKKEGAGDRDGDDDEERSSRNDRLSEARTFTPLSFYEEMVGLDLKEFVCLYHDPSQTLPGHFRFDRAQNVCGAASMSFLNVPIEVIKDAAVKSVLANEAMWFAVNMGVDQCTERGLMQAGLFDYETLFGLDLSISKADRSRLAAGASNHAMVLLGVDLDDGRPVRWLVENSWGDDKGRKGRWTLYDAWFTEHVYTVVVHRRHVPAEILDLGEEEPSVLPAWYPGAQGVQGG